MEFEFIGFSCFSLLYGLAFISSSAMRDNYLGLIAPLVNEGNNAYYVGLRGMVSGFLFDKRLIGLIHTLITLIFFTGLIILTFSKSSRFGDIAREIRLFHFLALISFISYFYQRKGWYYHLLPFFFLGVFSTCFIWSRISLNFLNFNRRLANIQARSAISACLAILSVFMLLDYLSQNALPKESYLSEILKKLPSENSKVIVVSTSMAPAFPNYIQLNKEPGSRFLWFFTIPLLYSNTERANTDELQTFTDGAFNKPLEKQFISELKSDIIKNQPDSVIINNATSDKGLPRYFNLVHYLEFHQVSNVLQDYYVKSPEHSGTNSYYQIWIHKRFVDSDINTD